MRKANSSSGYRILQVAMVGFAASLGAVPDSGSAQTVNAVPIQNSGVVAKPGTGGSPCGQLQGGAISGGTPQAAGGTGGQVQGTNVTGTVQRGGLGAPIQGTAASGTSVGPCSGGPGVVSKGMPVAPSFGTSPPAQTKPTP